MRLRCGGVRLNSARVPIWDAGIWYGGTSRNFRIGSPACASYDPLVLDTTNLPSERTPARSAVCQVPMRLIIGNWLLWRYRPHSDNATYRDLVAINKQDRASQPW